MRYWRIINSVIVGLMIGLCVGYVSCADEDKPAAPTGPGEVRFYKISGDNQDCIPMVIITRTLKAIYLQILCLVSNSRHSIILMKLNLTRCG